MTKEKSPGAGRAVWDLLASVKLAVVVLIVLAIVSILGTILPQGQSPDLYKHEYGQAFAKFILAVRLNNVYASPWYLALLAALAVNLIVCSIERLPKAVKAAFDKPDPESLRVPKLKIRREIISPAKPEEALAQARARAKVLGGMMEADKGGGKTVIFAQSGGWSRLGAYIIHSAILILFAGGLMTGLVGFKGYVNILEGDTIDRIVLKKGREMALDFQVKLNKFTFNKYPDGSPKEWISDLIFIRDGKQVKKASVAVNSPASFGKITFYQSGYGEELGEWIELGLKRGDKEEVSLKVPRKGKVDVPELGRLSLARWSSNIRGIGPGARIKLEPVGGGEAEVFWVISRPPFQMRKSTTETFRLKGFDTLPYTGLQANYDPGVGFLWVGSIIMVLGLLIAFFWSHRRLYIEVCPHSQGTKITLAASTNRNKPALDKFFKDVCQDFQKPEAGKDGNK